MTTLLELNNICKQFASGRENLTILHDINLQIHSGETIAITGSSGSGKSTLLGIMAGLERPSSGTIRFQDKEIQDCNEDELASWRSRSVGFIFQNFRLVKKLTALENVALPLEIQGVGSQEAQQRAQQLLSEMGVDHRCDHFPHQLSGGEQQRVAIARAYAHHPQIIFADEPTGSLDQHTAEKVLQSLLQINQHNHTTLIVVTHDLQIAALLSRNIKLTGGQLVDENAA